MANDESMQQEATETDATDYKALWEQAKADAEMWKAKSRKNEDRAKSNAVAARELSDATQQLADLSERLAAIESENEKLKADAERVQLVAKVAESTGVPEQIVSALAANDEKSLIKAANAIAETYRVPAGAPSMPEAGMFPRGGQSKKTNAQQFGEAIDRMLGR